MKKILLAISLAATTALTAVIGCGEAANTTTSSKSAVTQSSQKLSQSESSFENSLSSEVPLSKSSSSISDTVGSSQLTEGSEISSSQTTSSESSSSSEASSSSESLSSERESISQESSSEAFPSSPSSESSSSSEASSSSESLSSEQESSNEASSSSSSSSSSYSDDSSSLTSSSQSSSTSLSSSSTGSSSSIVVKKKYEIIFYGVDQEVLYSAEIEEGSAVEYLGERPEKEETDEYSFTFAGWSTTEGGQALAEIPLASQNASYYAVFSSVVREYTVTLQSDNGMPDTVIENVPYGTPASVIYETEYIPTKEGHTFEAWYLGSYKVEKTNTVYGDMVLTAGYTKNSYTITWVVDGNTTTSSVEYGSLPTFSGSTYKYGYEFTGWSPEITTVTKAETYTAQYTDTSVWNGTYPTVTNGYTFSGEGTQESPWLIQSAQDLAALSRLTTGKTSYGAGTYYKLTINIDLSIGGWVPICDGDTTAGGWHDPANFFLASFNGSDKTITFNETNVQLCFGLFQGLANCTVENLTIGGTVTGQHYHAGLATYFNGGVTAKNITSNVNMTVGNTSDAQARTGGIVGQINGSNNKLINCTNNGNITVLSTQSHVGGLVGFAYGQTTLENCSNTGTITGKITAINDFGSSSDGVGRLIGTYNTSFTISWNVAGTVTTSSVVAGDTPTFTGNSTVSGYEFKGWSTSDGGAVTGTSVAVKDTTYYAVLEKITTTYTLTWIVDGVSQTETVLHGSTPSRAKPTLANHVFSGWSTSENGELVGLETLSITKDTEFYAIFDRLLESEFRAQVAHFGGPSGTTNSARMRLSFSIKMKAGATFTFIGTDTQASTYKWTVNETQNTANMFASTYIDAGWNTAPKSTDAGKGWSSSTLYTTQSDCYPVIVLARIDGAALTNSEVELIKTMFKVTGTKLSPLTLYEEGTLTTEEYNAQVAGMGSFHQPVENTRGRIMFSVRMGIGTKVTYLGDSTYNWAVVETGNHITTTKYLDSGWNTTWTDTTAYYTKIDGSYMVITVKKADGSTFDNAAIAALHSLFKVEGTKRIAFATQVDYDIKAINHRGHNYLAPENTLEAYTLSAMSGFKYVECDISFTKDQIPVLLHDETIDRTSTGTGNIADLTLAEARQYDYGSWFSSEWAGVQIPTLEEFLLLCKEYNLHPYIEIKWNSSFTLTDAQAKIIVDMVEKCGMTGQVSYISFNVASLGKIAALDGSARLGYVYSSTLTQEALDKLIALKTDTNSIFMDVYYSQGATGHATVTMCKNAGVPLEVWTADGATIDSLDEYVSGVSSEYTNAGQYLQQSI